MNKLYAVPFFMMLLCLGLVSCKKSDNAADNPNDPNILPATDSLKIGLIAYYPFNNSGVDESGNGNNGLVYNITSANDRNGKINSAYYFDGFSSYVQVKDNLPLRLNNTDITINTWVKLDEFNFSYGSYLVSKRSSGINNGWASSITGFAYQYSNQGPVGVTTFGSGGGNVYASGVKVLSINKWYMITSVYNVAKLQVSIYVNGVLDNITTGVSSPNSAITSDMYIGRDNPANVTNGYYLKGCLDDVRIYNRALKITEIQKLYTSAY
jgi:hypothetical protein